MCVNNPIKDRLSGYKEIIERAAAKCGPISMLPCSERVYFSSSIIILLLR